MTIRPGYAVSVILASHGYPGNYSKGKKIQISDADLPSGMVATFLRDVH